MTRPRTSSRFMMLRQRSRSLLLFLENACHRSSYIPITQNIESRGFVSYVISCWCCHGDYWCCHGDYCSRESVRGVSCPDWSDSGTGASSTPACLIPSTVSYRNSSCLVWVSTRRRIKVRHLGVVFYHRGFANYHSLPRLIIVAASWFIVVGWAWQIYTTIRHTM
jgi:hypothetical protein